MKTVTPLANNDKNIRTQITLTSTLKRLIEKEIKPKNQSLSDYLRQAAILKLYLDRQEKQDLQELSTKVIGSIDLKNHPHWKSAKQIKSWQKEMRQEWPTDK